MDDYSRYGYIYPIKERIEALDKFKIFKAEVENQDDKRLAHLPVRCIGKEKIST
jgi:hypothetical protein